jgi:hypothetical protein
MKELGVFVMLMAAGLCGCDDERPCRSDTRMGASGPPRIVKAIILAERSLKDEARALLAEQVLETRNPGHPDYVRRLAKQLGLGSLDS